MGWKQAGWLAGTAILASPLAWAQAPGSPQAPAAPVTGAERHQRVDRAMMLHGLDDRGMGMVPPGTWWRNPGVIARLGLSADQQKKMDDIFHQSRIQLIDLKAGLEKEQLNLEPLLNANPVDSGKALAEISRIADLRADLEKANAKMLLGLRAVLTADQWTKLQADQHGRGDESRQFRDHAGRPTSGTPPPPGN